MTASWLDDYLRDHVSGLIGDVTAETSYSTPVPRITVQKYQMFMPISTDLAMDFGLIPDTRPPAPPVPWRRQLRVRWFNWRANTRQRIAERAYKLISGDEFPSDDPYDD